MIPWYVLRVQCCRYSILTSYIYIFLFYLRLVSALRSSERTHHLLCSIHSSLGYLSRMAVRWPPRERSAPRLRGAPQSSQSVESLGRTKLRQKNNPRRDVCAFLADSTAQLAPHKQTTAREIEATLLMGCVGAFGAPDSSPAIDRQKRLTTCFRVLESMRASGT